MTKNGQNGLNSPFFTESISGAVSHFILALPQSKTNYFANGSSRSTVWRR